MLIRFFGAAQAAAGTAEEKLPMAEGSTLNDVLLELVRRHPAPLPDAGQRPSLSSVITRSSFLCNEVAVKDRTRRLGADDVVDVLPPFAGG